MTLFPKSQVIWDYKKKLKISTIVLNFTKMFGVQKTNFSVPEIKVATLIVLKVLCSSIPGINTTSKATPGTIVSTSLTTLQDSLSYLVQTRLLLNNLKCSLWTAQLLDLTIFCLIFIIGQVMRRICSTFGNLRMLRDLIWHKNTQDNCYMMLIILNQMDYQEMMIMVLWVLGLYLHQLVFSREQDHLNTF